MTNSSGPQTWNLSMGAGSSQDWMFTFAYPSTGALYPIGDSWEYVAQNSAGSQVISVNGTANSQGVLTIGTASSTVQLTLYPAATQSLAVGQYSHALWSDPGLDTAYTWLGGALSITANPQP